MKGEAGADESQTDPGRARRRSRLRLLRTAALAIVGALGGIVAAADVQVGIGPFTSTFLARPALDGDTTVSLAPLGTIQLDTHDAPLAIDVRVDELRLDEAEAIAQDPAVLERFETEVVADAKSALRALALRTALAAVLGALAGALVSAVAWRSLIIGGVIGAVLVGGVLGATLGTWRAEAVAEPRYTGLLTIAPKAVGDVEAVIERFGRYRAQLAELVENVVTLYGVGANLPSFDPSRATTRLLHVSDVHLNPQAFDLMRQVIAQFDVDAVVDTGDTTDWGSEPESQLLDQIAQLGVPYVWVRGNHDSRRTQEAVAAQANGVVLDGDAREVAGLRIWGSGDPRYTPDKSQPVGKDVERDQAAAAAPGVAAALRADMPPPVDVVVVHDARLAAAAGELTPLVLAGHTHEPRQSRLGKAILLVEGSTGGAGLRGLQGEEPEPLTCSVLYFNPTTRALVAYDRITVEGLGQTGVRIERSTLGRSLPTTTAPPVTTTEPGVTGPTTSTTAP
ncbi:MAG TPA: metallophosphoesterase [Acidimicrobiales bacterium]|nr:metallophosphoesterase [Acidimicrobiales bacterium]